MKKPFDADPLNLSKELQETKDKLKAVEAERDLFKVNHLEGNDTNIFLNERNNKLKKKLHALEKIAIGGLDLNDFQLNKRLEALKKINELMEREK